MVPWRLLIGAVVGAIAVKEWPRAGKAYDLIRARIKSAMERSHEGTVGEDAGPKPAVQDTGHA